MPGLKHSPTTEIVLGLTKGITALDITLLPKDSSSIFSTTFVLTPVLVKSVLDVVIVVTLVPCISPERSSNEFVVRLTTPLHCVCHAFHTVPRTP